MTRAITRLRQLLADANDPEKGLPGKTMEQWQSFKAGIEASLNELEAKKDFCCLPFEDAHQSGTDNEGFGPLLRIDTIGCELPPIKYCPWCGAQTT